MRCARNKNRLSYFFLLFLPYYLERVDLFCIFVPTVETNSPTTHPLTAQTHPHPLPKGGELPTISPKGRVKHLTRNVTLKL